MTTASAIPTAIDTLVTIATAALSDAEVIDGPGAHDRGEYAVTVHIGATDPDEEEGTTAASSEQVWAWLGHVQRKTEFSISCVIAAWNGEADQKKARDAAFGALQAFTDAITDDPSLSGDVIAVSGIEDITFTQSQDKDGAHARITFGLPITAWLE